MDSLARQLGESLTAALRESNLWPELSNRLAEIAKRFRAALDEGIPSGWAALTVEEMLAVIDLMAETGWCLTTSPSGNALRAILSASDIPSKGDILLQHEPQILHDLDIELRCSDASELPLFASAARQSWDAHASGLFLASQALSTAALAALADRRGPLDFKSLGAARAHLDGLDLEKGSLHEIKFIAVGRAVGTALANFSPDGPEPSLFNRHASAHGLSTIQYTQLNSLTALMLLCGWLREVSWLLHSSQSD